MTTEIEWIALTKKLFLEPCEPRLAVNNNQQPKNEKKKITWQYPTEGWCKANVVKMLYNALMFSLFSPE
jgi:hypothetical protein